MYVFCCFQTFIDVANNLLNDNTLSTWENKVKQVKTLVFSNGSISLNHKSFYPKRSERPIQGVEVKKCNGGICPFKMYWRLIFFTVSLLKNVKKKKHDIHEVFKTLQNKAKAQ